MTDQDWDHKDEWRKRGKNFLVTVSRHFDLDHKQGSCYDSEGPHRWAVYAYVYPKHPLFDKFDADKGMWQQPSLPLHSYPSFYKAHRKEDGTITSHQIGADYHHDGDWRFTQHDNRHDAYQQFNDAQELFDCLTARAVETPAT